MHHLPQMPRFGVLIGASLLCCAAWAQNADGNKFSGRHAFDLTAQAVAFGPRPDGSAAIAKLRTFHQTATRGQQMGCIHGRFHGANAGRPLADGEHHRPIAGQIRQSDRGFRSLRYEKNWLVSWEPTTAVHPPDFFLELARVLRNRPRTDDIILIFFDGEEAVRDWSDTDSVYGSRHLSGKWSADGSINKLKALLNVDMIGDKDLRLVWETSSAPSLRKLVWDVADSLGYSASFPREGSPVSDDHIPFINAGVRALDLIDFESQNTFWHTPQDTMDKLSAQSFEIVGQVVLKSIEELEQQK